MSSRSLSRLYYLAEAGDTQALLAHITELSAEFSEPKDLASLALIRAAESNQLETAQALIKYGAGIEGASERSYIRPLWKAAKRGHLPMVKLLFVHGANIEATDSSGMSALDYAKHYSRAEVVEFLKSCK